MHLLQAFVHPVPYYPGRCGLDLPRTLRPIKMAQCASPVGMRRKDRQCIQVFCWQCVCSVCKEEGGHIEGLVPIILRARPVRWVSPRPCTTCSYSASLICYPSAGSHWRTARAPLNPLLVACHRLKRTRAVTVTGGPVLLCQPEIISEYALS